MSKNAKYDRLCNRLKKFAKSNEGVEKFFVKCAQFLKMRSFYELPSIMKNRPEFINKLFTETVTWGDDKFDIVVFFVIILTFLVYEEDNKDFSVEEIKDKLVEYDLSSKDAKVNKEVVSILFFVFNEYDFVPFDKNNSVSPEGVNKILKYEEKNGLSKRILVRISEGLKAIGVENLTENLLTSRNEK